MKQFSKDLGNVSLAPKGRWSKEQEYERLNLVYNDCDNLSYVAKIDVPIGVEIDNREYWQPMNATGYADNNFINLTTESETGTVTAYESLEEAVATILPINRRAGATLSFYNLNADRLDRQAEFELWQFNSTDLANWENRNYWNNIYYNWNVFAGWYVGADGLKNHVKIPNVGQYAYVGTNLNDALLYQCRTNGTWTNTGIKVRNYISVVVSGNITIGENGNWFSDGKDTGIPATPAVDEQLDNIIMQLQQHTTEINNLKASYANFQNQITNNDNDIATLNTKHESLSRTVQGIAATGGASIATNVTYNNDSSGLNAENAQDAIDEVSSVITYDVSAHNGGVAFESLQALLSSSSLSTLIPTSVRHGGMSIRFIQGSVPSSDNKYVQYRLMNQNWSTVDSDWQNDVEMPIFGKSLGALYPTDGSGYYNQDGTITPYPDYRNKVINISSYGGKIVCIRSGFIDSDKTVNISLYNYVLTSDNQYLRFNILCTTQEYAIVLLPENAVSLLLSWDTNPKQIGTTPYVYLIYSNIVSGFLQQKIEKHYKELNVLPYDGSGYFSKGGVIESYQNYKYKIFNNMEQYAGKTMYFRFGSPFDPADWCWVKFKDGTYIKLSTLGTKIDGIRIFVMPENVLEIEASIDTTVEFGIVPLFMFDDIESNKLEIESNKLEIESNKLEIENVKQSIKKPFTGKTIFLFGDSISSMDYPWYKNKLSEITGATVLNQGASGRAVAYQASNEYFQLLVNNPNDIVVVLVGGNDSGASGTIGTFNTNSPLGKMGESVVQETDISVDYNGTKFIQAVSHIIRKWRNLYWNFRINVLTAHILDTESNNAVVYPIEGTATESQCIDYAESQGWILGYGQRYVMMTTESNVSKREKLVGVRQPKMFICTTLPQKRYNSSNIFSNPQNWERKRLACIECAQKYNIPLIDLAKEFAIDWNAEPFWPGQGYTITNMTDNQGIYTMDGLHPNEFGYDYISQIVYRHLIKDMDK